MEMNYKQISMKMNDFKMCAKCEKINFYENEKCFECGDDVFVDMEIRDLEKEYNFYKEEGEKEIGVMKNGNKKMS